MRTVGDLIKVLNYYSSILPEFEKYNLCIDISDDNDIYPNLKDVEIYINSDIGQVEMSAITEEQG